MKTLSKLFFVFTLVFWGSNTANAQTSLKDDKADKKAEVKGLVNSGRYTFEATKEIPKKGDIKPLSPGPDLDISKDTLIVYLPNLGKDPMTPVSARAAGITCTHFSYNMEPGKNGHWEVTIQPKERPGEMRDVREFKMDISSLGYTTLTVMKTNRSHMIYYGYIKQHSAEFPRVNAQF